MRWGKYLNYRDDSVSVNEFVDWIENEQAAASAIYQPTTDEKEKKDKRVIASRSKQ